MSSGRRTAQVRRASMGLGALLAVAFRLLDDPLINQVGTAWMLVELAMWASRSRTIWLGAASFDRGVGLPTLGVQCRTHSRTSGAKGRTESIAKSFEDPAAMRFDALAQDAVM